MTSIQPRTRSLSEFARLDYTGDGAAGGHLELVLHDEIDLADAQLLEDTLHKVAALPACDITVELANVTFFSSTGLGFLAGVNNYAIAGGRTVTITNPQPIVRRALTVCGFDQVITIIPADESL